MNMTDTQITRRPRFVRARFTLPLEMCLFTSMLLDGISGTRLAGGRLWESLMLYGESVWSGVPVWGWVLVPIASAGLALATIEWHGGRRWSDEALLRACRLRSFIAWAGLFASAYQSWTLLVLIPDGHRVFTIAWSGLAQIPFFAWCWCAARKASLALDDRIPTTRLESQYARARSEW